jgi:hypothetical protein
MKRETHGKIFSKKTHLIYKLVIIWSSLNRIPVMAPILAPILGVHFFRVHISLKTGHIAPFLATIQRLSKTRVFLSGEKKRKLICMGRTFTVARLYHSIITLNMLVVSWESNLARVKASGRGAKFYPSGCYFSLYT